MFFKITNLVKPYLYFSDIVDTIVDYFYFSVGFVQEVAENVVIIGYSAFIDITNIQGFSFSESSSQHTDLLDLINYLHDVNFIFIFSTVNANTIDHRLHKHFLSIKFFYTNPRLYPLQILIQFPPFIQPSPLILLSIQQFSNLLSTYSISRKSRIDKFRCVTLIKIVLCKLMI